MKRYSHSREESHGHPCCCPCHPHEERCHHELRCRCGGPIVPPCGCGKGPHGPECPPPDGRPHPGTVELPQDPPPRFPTYPEPPRSTGKPPPGDPGEVPWFRGQVGGITVRGPKFGPRKDEFLPYLLVRAASGDRGSRPVQGVFWESPDIYIDPGHGVDAAPLLPPTAGGLANAGRPNTLYAHVWNLGKAPAHGVRVEFYWFNPSLGISRADANLVGAAYVDLQNRFTTLPTWTRVESPTGAYASRGSHAIVRCPTSWVPTFENNGHECLVVRALEPFLDAVSPDQFNATANRHVAQRNIAVAQATSPAEIDLALDLGYLDRPSDVEIEVETAPPSAMEWLKLLDRSLVHRPAPPADGIVAGLLGPVAAGVAPLRLVDVGFDSRGTLLQPRQSFHRGCDRLQIGFHASAADLGRGYTQVFRVRQSRDGDVLGGYSIVLTSPWA
jgi:hypothetical protein